MRRCSVIFIWIWCLSAIAAEVIPPEPPRHFNDYANVVGTTTADELDAKLHNFEQSTGNQVVVAVYPKMQSDSSIDDYTVRVARAWKVGQKGTNNGVVLFVFINDRKMFIQVGYGLEGVLPDALCKQITEYEIKPRFKAGDYAGGLTAGVNSIIAATRHEYKGTGATVFERQHTESAPNPALVIALLIFGGYIFLLVYSRSASARRHGWIISSGGWGGYSGGGGGGFSGGGGGFSGGGGSFGGGGAGSSW